MLRFLDYINIISTNTYLVCLTNHNPSSFQEKDFFKIRFNDDLAIEIASTDGLSGICAPGLQSKRKCIHNFLRDPRSSWLATIWHSIDIMFICISITFLVMETDPNIGRHFTDKEESAYKVLYSINTLVIIFFTVDLAVRFVTWPGLLSFWKNIFNILDFLSILPFFVSTIADSMADDGADSAATNKKYVVLRVCRIFRIVRIFKFVRHSRDLIMIVKVVMHAKKELFLLVILLAIFTITFGAVMYYVEHETNDQFNSIMTGCWWAIVTITTVGYGDISPTTPAGKFVGAVVLTLGIVFLALPMTIIVSKFSSVYEKEKSKWGDSGGCLGPGSILGYRDLILSLKLRNYWLLFAWFLFVHFNVVKTVQYYF